MPTPAPDAARPAAPRAAAPIATAAPFDPKRHPAWLARHHFGQVRIVCFALCAAPALWLLGEWWLGALGINPLNRLLHFTGRWAVTMLIVTLAVTPLRRLSMHLSQRAKVLFGRRVSDWNWLIRLRRQFGLFTFFYAALHFGLYVMLDAGPEVGALRDDLLDRPFIALGWAALGLLLPLAATSNQASMRALGGHWRRLHSLSYLIAVLAAAHFVMQAKRGQADAWPYVAALTLLLLARVVAWRHGDRGPAAEVRERQRKADRGDA